MAAVFSVVWRQGLFYTNTSSRQRERAYVLKLFSVSFIKRFVFGKVRFQQLLQNTVRIVV